MTIEDDARNFLRQFKSVVQFAQSVDGLTLLDDQIAGKQAALTDLQNKIDNANQSATDIQTQIDGLNAQSAQIDSDNTAKINMANVQAARIVATAKKNADDYLAQTQAKVDALKSTANDLRNQIGDLSNQVTAKQAELQSIQNDIDALKAKING